MTPPLYMADTPEKDSARYNAVLDIYAGWLNGQKNKGWLVADMRPRLSAKSGPPKKRIPDSFMPLMASIPARKAI
ncbi:MAG: hypothetical protein ACLSUW_10120 [Akkermansia sp.]